MTITIWTKASTSCSPPYWFSSQRFSRSSGMDLMPPAPAPPSGIFPIFLRIHFEINRNFIAIVIIIIISMSSPASCSLLELLASLEPRMGLPKVSRNCFSVPRYPGMRKSKRDRSSRTLFCMGGGVSPGRMSL